MISFENRNHFTFSMVGAGALSVFALVALGVVDAIVVRGYPPPYFQQPIRGHFANPEGAYGSQRPGPKTKWTFSPTAAGTENWRPQRTMLQKLLQQRRFRGSRMRNPLEDLGGKRANNFARVEVIPPPPVQIRCCVRYTPGFEPDYLNMQVLKPHAAMGFNGGGAVSSSPWESDSKGVTEEQPYDIPFPEYSLSEWGNKGQGLNELELPPAPVPTQTAAEIASENAYEVLVPRTKSQPTYGASPSSRKQRKRSKAPEDAKSGTEPVTEGGNALDEVPEPFRSWILAGDAGTTPTTNGFNTTQLPLAKIEEDYNAPETSSASKSPVTISSLVASFLQKLG